MYEDRTRSAKSGSERPRPPLTVTTRGGPSGRLVRADDTSQCRAQLPEQREEAKVTAAAQVAGSCRAAGARLVADLGFDDGGVQRAPLRRQLVVRQQALRHVPQVAVTGAVAGDGDERG